MKRSTEKYEHITLLIILINILNIMDLATTIFLYKEGWIVEANPVMNYFLQLGYGPFIFYKLTLVSFCSLLMYYGKKYVLSYYGFIIAFIIYFLIVARSSFFIAYIYYVL